MSPSRTDMGRPRLEQELALDPARERLVRADRLRALNTRTVPLLRLLGANFLIFAATTHNVLILGAVDWGAILWFALFMEAYCLVSWWVLDRWYDPDAAFDLALAFLVVDLIPLGLTVYVTGADSSWLFWIFLFRVVDQTSTYFIRAFMFTWLGALAYATVVGFAVVMDGAAVNVPGEIAKLLFLVLGGSYMAFTARTSERIRSRLAEAIRAARSSVAELQLKSRELEQAREAAEAGSQAKSQFLSRVSHELRTPMNAILGFAQLLEMEELTAEQQAYVDEIMDGGRHLLDIINEVLDIARVETGSLARELEPVHLGSAIRDVLERSGPAAARRQVALPDRPPPGSDVWVVGNARKVRQVVSNLVSNAVRFNEPGGSVSLACSHREGTIRVSITDTGPGIPAEQIDAAFTPFERLGAEKDGHEGAGLGLPVARSLLEAMDGRIGVDSEVGAGSTFWFELQSTMAPEAEASEEAGPVRDSEGPLILYIDDKPDNVALVRRILARRPSVELASAPLGRKGLELMRSLHPDLVLLDLELPDISGRAVLSEVLADPELADTPVIVVSAEADAATVEAVLAAGARAYFTMPYDITAFLAAVDEHLELG